MAEGRRPTAPSTAPAPTTTGPLWHDRNFGTYWAGQAVSQFGDRVSELAIPLTAVTVRSVLAASSRTAASAIASSPAW